MCKRCRICGEYKPLTEFHRAVEAVPGDARGARGGGRVKIGIVSDEISGDFAEALRIGTAVGIRRYEIRNLTAGRAPMCGDAAMAEAERLVFCADHAEVGGYLLGLWGLPVPVVEAIALHHVFLNLRPNVRKCGE
jgi:hypothetical protein